MGATIPSPAAEKERRKAESKAYASAARRRTPRRPTHQHHAAFILPFSSAAVTTISEGTMNWDQMIPHMLRSFTIVVERRIRTHLAAPPVSITHMMTKERFISIILPFYSMFAVWFPLRWNIIMAICVLIFPNDDDLMYLILCEAPSVSVLLLVA